MAKKPKAIISDKVYIPLKNANRPAIKKHLHVHHFHDKTCNHCGEGGEECDNKFERPNDTCGNCPAYHGLFKFYEQKEIGGKKYVGIAKGNPEIVEAVTGGLENYKVLDRRSSNKMKHKLRMKKKFVPRPHQPGAVKAMVEHGGGTLVAPPRSGKTAIVAMTSVELGLKTVVLAHQDDLIDQFYKTYMDFTNAAALEEKYGVGSVVKICKSEADWLSDADIKLGTYQKFIRSKKARKLLRKVSRMAGMAAVDEGHKANATAYAKTVGTFDTRYLYTLTATPDRKDGKEFIMYRVVGKVIHECEIESLKPKVYAHISKSKAKVSSQNWMTTMKTLLRNETRRRHIVELVMEQLDKGHSIVLACSPPKVEITKLTEEINKAWMEKKNTMKPIAASFYAYPNVDMKKKVLNDARSGKIRVVVALRTMLTGVDVPVWSSFIQVTPSSNSPNWKQESMRVCTPHPTKPKPEIHMIVDTGCTASMSCFRSTIGFSQTFGYKMHKSVGQVLEIVGRFTGKLYSDKHQSSKLVIGKPGRGITL